MGGPQTDEPCRSDDQRNQWQDAVNDFHDSLMFSAITSALICCSLEFSAEQLFFCKFFGLGRVGSEDGKKFLGFQRERVILGRER
jgi:hypothetical protein